MAKAKVPKTDTPRLNAATRKAFLAHLAQTANVSASARVAGIDGDAAYAERRRLPVFLAEWMDALGEGYARLEANMLAEALQPANGKTSDGTLKARAQKHRLGISLLTAHRASVKGPAAFSVATTKVDLGAVKAQLTLKLTQMRERAGISLEGRPAVDEAE